MCARNILCVTLSSLVLPVLTDSELTGLTARACSLLRFSEAVLVLFKNCCGPFLLQFETYLQVLALPWRIMPPRLSLSACCHVKLLVVIDVIKGMVPGCHFDTGTKFPVRGFLALGPIAVNTDVI